MDKVFLDKVYEDARAVFTELIDMSGVKSGDVVVIGCPSSEIVGERIGKGSSRDAARAICDAVLPMAAERGIFIAAQCCEHLNRALIVERECAEKYGLEIVSVLPQPSAGGSFATECYERFSDPVAVEQISAHAGMDIGLTLIGMHLRCVAVPLRLSVSKIGEATVTFAKTRPKFIGGIRAKYPDGAPETNR